MKHRHSDGSRNPGFLVPPGISKIFLPAFAASILFSACQKPQPPKPPLVETVAVLPFDNESNDVNAPDVLQSLVYWALRPSPYRVSDIKETNDKLAKNGIVDGGQLPALDPVKIGKDLGVQALLYGYISDFGYVDIGFYRSRKVGLTLKMVDASTGQTLWENSGTTNNAKVALNAQEARNQFAKGLADQMTDKAFKTPLQEEAESAVAKTLRTLPGFQFCGFQNTPLRANPVKNVIRGRINQ